MMFNYQIIIEYDGTDFVGWQIQKNGFSVQEAIQKTLTKILKHKIIRYRIPYSRIAGNEDDPD